MHELKPFPLINKQKKFIMFTNAKCGGTSLKRWFQDTLDVEHTFSNPVSAIRHYGADFLYKWYKYSLFCHNMDKITNTDKFIREFVRLYVITTRDLLPEIIDDPNWFRFAVVRNPYDRLVSAYLNKFCGRELEKKWVQQVLSDTNPGINDPDAREMSFRTFVDYLSEQDNDRVNYHWRRQTYVFKGVNFDQVIKLEQLSNALPPIEKRLGVRSKTNLTKRRMSSTYAGRKIDPDRFFGDHSNREIIKFHEKNGFYPPRKQFYDAELKAKVAQLYMADFEFVKTHCQEGYDLPLNGK